MIADNFNVDIFVPLMVMRLSLPAELLKLVPIDENVFEVSSMTSCALALSYISTVIPLSAVTFADNSESRESF